MILEAEGKEGADKRDRSCQNGVLQEYLTYAAYQESPTDFHTWVCMSMMAITLGRDCWINWGAWKIFPNLFIVLVGESALTHKSTAIRMGMKPMMQALPELHGTGQKMSPEALSNYLSKLSEEHGEAVAHINASELSVLIGKSKLDDSLLKLLTDLWDSEDQHTSFTIGRGEEKMVNICLNMIAGTTPEWLKNSVPTETLEGGFFSRLILVQRPPSGVKNARPRMRPEHVECLDNVKADLMAMSQIAGPFTLTPEAEQVYDLWYYEHNDVAKAESFMRGYLGRKGDMILKMSMALSASFDDSRIISEDYILFALELLNENEEFTKGIVKFMGTTEEGAKYLHVLNKIKKSVVNITESKKSVIKTGIDHSSLMRAMSHKYKSVELAEVIDALTQSGEIEPFMEGNKRCYLYTAGRKED